MAMTTIMGPNQGKLATYLQKQIDDAHANLRLIEVRKSQYILSTDIPLQLVREEELWHTRLAALEEQATQVADDGTQPPATRVGGRLLMWLLGMTLVAALAATIIYALYLVTVANHNDMPVLVGISLLAPLVVGWWVGWQESESSRLDYYLGAALTVGVLNALGVALCLSVYLRDRPTHIDWNRVFELYFLTPALVFSAGRVIGKWWRHRALAAEAEALVTAPPSPSLAARAGLGSSTAEALSAIGALLVAVVTFWLAYWAATQ